jgi:hypothetical protein
VPLELISDVKTKVCTKLQDVDKKYFTKGRVVKEKNQKLTTIPANTYSWSPQKQTSKSKIYLHNRLFTHFIPYTFWVNLPILCTGRNG